MSKNKRNGNRKTRDENKNYRQPYLGYYSIITDTEATERYYFEGIRDSLPKDIKDNLVIKVVETKTERLLEKCTELIAYNSQYSILCIVFDRDRVTSFDKIIREAEEKGIRVGWSNPCFEIWLYAYFGSMPNISESKKCCSEFSKIYKSKTNQLYKKADKQIYYKVLKYGDEENAIKIAQQKYRQCLDDNKTKPSDMLPCTTLYELVNEIKIKIKNTENLN